VANGDKELERFVEDMAAIAAEYRAPVMKAAPEEEHQ